MNRCEVNMQKPMVVPIPERGREMKTSRIPQISLDTMRLQLLGTMKNHKSEPIINNLDIIDKNIKFTEISKNQPKDIYHQACKKHALFLIPDTTLEDMKTIVNSKVSKKKETRYRDPKVEELSQYDYFMHKLDTVIEKLDDLDSTSESSCASHLSDKDIEEYMVKSYTQTPFNFLIYKLNNIVRKLDEITKPLPDGSIEKLYQEELFLKEPSEMSTSNEDSSINKSVTSKVENRNTGKEDHVTTPLNPFTQSINLEEHKLYYCATKTELSQILPTNQPHINRNIDLSKPLLLSSTLQSKSLNFTVAGHFNDCKPIFQVQKCDFDNISHELSMLHRKKNTNINNTYTQKSKKLHISIAGKLLKKQNISQCRNNLGKQTSKITVVPELQEQVTKVFSFKSSISKCDLNQLHISISGEYTKDEDKDQYFPAVSIQIKQNNTFLRRRSQKIQSVNSKLIDIGHAREFKNVRRGKLLKGSRQVKNRKSAKKIKKLNVNNILESNEEINLNKNIQSSDYESTSKDEENESLVNIVLFHNEEHLEEEEFESKSETSIPYHDLPMKSEEKLLLKKTKYNYENPQSYDLEGNIDDEKNQTTVENKIKYQEQTLSIFKTNDIAVYNVISDTQTNIFKDAQNNHGSPTMIITTKDDFASKSKIVKKVNIIKKSISYVGGCIRNKLKGIKTRTMSLLNKKGAKSNSDLKNEQEKPNVLVKRKKQKGPNICENPILGQFEEFFID